MRLFKANYMECIKTGADVIVGNVRVHGDLFMDERRKLYILNATGCTHANRYMDGLFAIGNIKFYEWQQVGEVYFCSFDDAGTFHFNHTEIEV